jgi:ABC-2 type transport system permease protein
MTVFLRYVRLWFALARFALLGELAFRGNFLMKMLVEVLWLIILLMFYRTVFASAKLVAGWRQDQYLFFVGCYFALEGLIETLFLENCQDFSYQVRTGNLDTALLQPLDEQFLVTCRKIDWSTVPNFLMGSGVMIMSLMQNPEWHFSWLQLLIFIVVFFSALMLAYSFLLILTSTAVWMIRNQSLMELWWLFSSLMRYPREIFTGTWAAPIGFVFTFLLPVMLVINVPANVMVRSLEPEYVLFIVAATVIMLGVSRWFFRRALRRYRSASS